MVDLYFVLDSSGSIRVERFPTVLDFMADIVAQLDVHPTRARVGLIYWSDSAALQFPLNRFSNRQDVIQAIKRTPFMGERTNTASALRMLKDSGFTAANGDRDFARNIALMITDGNSNINPEDTIPEAIETRVNNVLLLAVAVGKTFVNQLEIEGIASEPSDLNIFQVERYSELSSRVKDLAAGTCNGESHPLL